jgi:serine/threonine protein kinase
MSLLKTRATMRDLVGQVLGESYKILSTLDEGAMGAVYRAEHVRLKHQVAVKVMAESLLESDHAHARFIREAEIISRLHHPHIVQVFDFDTTPDGRSYLVMELLQGVPLDTYLYEHGPLPLHTAVTVILQCASALTVAHTSGIIHRDLKPANIIVRDVDSAAFVKLLDFGIGKVSDSEVGRRLTGEFDILGTPEYMPPEQALGLTAQIDARGDQYSLAVVLYELLTGKVPHEGASIAETLFEVIHANPAPPSSHSDAVPPEVDAVVLRALSKKPRDRYPSVAAFAKALQIAVTSSGLSSSGGRSAIPRSTIQVRRPSLMDRSTLVLRQEVALNRSDITPRQAFVLSRVETEAPLSLVIDLCPYTAEQTLEELRELIVLGYLRVKKAEHSTVDERLA